MNFAYHNHGQMTASRAADAVALGSLGGAHTLARPTLPAPGAPEVMAGLGDCGCGCKGAGTCGKGMGDLSSVISGMSTVQLALVGGAAYLLYKHFKKKRR